MLLLVLRLLVLLLLRLRPLLLLRGPGLRPRGRGDRRGEGVTAFEDRYHAPLLRLHGRAQLLGEPVVVLLCQEVVQIVEMRVESGADEEQIGLERPQLREELRRHLVAQAHEGGGGVGG